MIFDITIEEANIILQALGEVPYRVSFSLVEKLKQQAQPQLQEAQAEQPDVPETPKSK